MQNLTENKVILSKDQYNMLRNSNSYSTTEHVIGTWTNGKPLYQKLLIIDAPSDTDASRHSNTIYTIPDNIEDCIIDYGRSWYQWTQAPWYETTKTSILVKTPTNQYIKSESTATSDQYLLIRLKDNEIEYLTQGNNWLLNSNHSNRQFYITIQYTKISDTAVVSE